MMPFRDDILPPLGLTIDGGLDLTPAEREVTMGEAFTSALRIDNTVVSGLVEASQR